MRRVYLVAFLVLCLSLAWMGLAVGEETKEATKEKSPHDYIGDTKCKICHKKSGLWDSYLETAHATAYEKLTDEQKKNPEILKYYMTGVTPKGDTLYNVQCEACHGPGNDYKSKSVMEDRELAIANGMIVPTAENCMTCHNDKAPAAVAAVAKDFDFEKMKETGVHIMPYGEE